MNYKYLVVFGFSCCAQAQQLPEGAQVFAGDIAIIQENAETLRIHQKELKGVIDWTTFNIGPNSKVCVDQPTSKALLLNRVMGDAPSVLAGRLEANGGVLLVNPNGIDITGTGVVNAAAFAASTVTVDGQTLENFLIDRTPSHPNGLRNLIDKTVTDAKVSLGLPGMKRMSGVTHQGRIELSTEGTALLVGSTVEVGGHIIADGGRIGITALTTIPATTAHLGDSVPSALLSSLGPASQPIPAAVRVSGVLRAKSTNLMRGQILVAAPEQGLSISGVLDASAEQHKGGLISITAAHIDIKDAVLNVSGEDWGGAIAVATTGGTPTGNYITVTGSSKLMANGDGGAIDIATGGGVFFDAIAEAKCTSAARLSAVFGGVFPVIYDEGHKRKISIVSGAKMRVRGELDTTGHDARVQGEVFLYGAGLRIAPWDSTSQDPGVSSNTDSTANMIDAATIQAALRHAHVFITSHGQNQTERQVDLTVDAPLTWTAGTSLVMNSARGMQIKAPIVASGHAASVHLGVGPDMHRRFDGGSIVMTGKRAMVSLNGVRYTMISSADELKERLSAGDGGRYVLAGPIDMKHVDFQPIDSASNKYFSHFDGLGNAINNVRIDQTSRQNTGLFGTLGGAAHISNIVLNDAYVRGDKNVGALVGRMQNASRIEAVTLRNVQVSNLPHNALEPDGFEMQVEDAFAAMTIHRAVGGAVGVTHDHSALNEIVGDIKVSGNGHVGGVVGTMFDSSTVDGAAFKGVVVGSGPAGGLLGTMCGNPLLTRSSWSGSVSGLSPNGDGDGPYGGLLAVQHGGRVKHSTALGTVSGLNHVGGLLGAAFSNSSITHCTARNTVRGNRCVGGLAGSVSGSAEFVTNSMIGRVAGQRDVGALVGYFEGGMVADNRTHGVVDLFGRSTASTIGRRGKPALASYIAGPSINLEEMPFGTSHIVDSK